MAKTNAPKSAARNTTAKGKQPAAQQEALVLNHAETLDAGDMALNDLIASLNAPEEGLGAAADEVIEETLPEVDTAEVDDATLEAAVAGAEATEAAIAAATPDGVVEPGAAPTGDASDVSATPAEGEAAPEKAKRSATPRKHYTDKTERLKDKLGAGLAEYSVLTLADATVDEEALKLRMEETMAVIKGMNKKEQNWAVKFIEFIAGKKSSMSEVTQTILTLLHKDGFITTGNDGTVFKKLVARPYSPGAARAMGGNNVGMLVDLKVIKQEGKGRYVPNEDSLLLMKVNSMLFAAPAAAPSEGEPAAA